MLCETTHAILFYFLPAKELFHGESQVAYFSGYRVRLARVRHRRKGIPSDVDTGEESDLGDPCTEVFKGRLLCHCDTSGKGLRTSSSLDCHCSPLPPLASQPRQSWQTRASVLERGGGTIGFPVRWFTDCSGVTPCYYTLSRFFAFLQSTS